MPELKRIKLEKSPNNKSNSQVNSSFINQSQVESRDLLTSPSPAPSSLHSEDNSSPAVKVKVTFHSLVGLFFDNLTILNADTCYS